MSEGVGDLLFFPASVLPVGWGISKVLTFVDERGLRGVSCMHVLFQPQRRFQRSVYTTERKWQFYPFRVGSIGAYGPVAERIKVQCFFAKTIGTVPLFVGSVPFLLCRVNAPLRGVYTTERKLGFTRSENGTDPTKTGTVPTVFANKQ